MSNAETLSATQAYQRARERLEKQAHHELAGITHAHTWHADTDSPVHVFIAVLDEAPVWEVVGAGPSGTYWVSKTPTLGALSNQLEKELQAEEHP